MKITVNLFKTKLQQVCNRISPKICFVMLFTSVIVGLIDPDQDTLVPEG